MAVVGRAAILVTPSFKGFQKEVAGEIPPAGKKAGQTFGSRFSTGFKRVAKVGVVAGAALVGAALTKGFGRLKAIEEAQAKLRGLGNDTKAVDAIMKNALASVKGTAFGLGDAATAAASLVAAGVKPGEGLERTLKSIANSASAAGVGLDEMSSIYGKVFSLGKAQNDSLQQVADKGIPIYQALADMLGVTTDEVFKMASAGDISADQFEKAMTKASGTVAKEMGTTFTGRLSNAWAALGRIGANLLSGVFPKMAGALGKITDALGPMEDKAAVLGEAFGEWLSRAVTGLVQMAGWLQRNSSWLLPIVSGVLAMVAAYKTYIGVMALAKTVTNAFKVAQAALSLVMSLNPIGIVIAAIIGLGVALVVAYKKSETFRNIVNAAWAGIKKVVGAVVGWFTGTALPFMKNVFAAIGNAAKWLWSKAIKPAVTAIQRGWQNLANAVRRIWNGFLRPVFELFGAIVKRLYQVFVRPYINAIRALWSALGTAIRSVYNRHLKPIVDAFKRIIGAMRSSISGQIAAVRSIWTSLGTGIRSTYNRHIKPIIDGLKTAVRSIKGAFKVGVDAAGKQWDRLKAKIKGPVKFAINTVLNNGLIAGFNKLARTFKTTEISPIKLRGFSEGGYTGAGGKYQPAGVVHADEFVISKAARRKFEKSNPGALDHLNMYGRLPGFAKGGRVWPVKNRHWTTYPGHTGIDFPVPMGTPVFASEDGRISSAQKLATSYGHHFRLAGKSGITTIYAHLSKMIAKVGQSVKAGNQIGNVGSTGNSTGPHLHFETRPGGSPGAAAGYLGGAGVPKGGKINSLISKVMGAFSSVKDWLVSKFSGPLDKLKEITSNPFGRLAAGLPRKIKGDLIDYAVDKMSFDSGGMLQPGYTLAYNGTRRPEPVFTGKQHDAMQAGGPQRMVGELVLKNGKAYIEGIVADVAGDALTARSF